MIKPLSVIVIAVLVAGGAALYMSKQSTQVSESSAASAPSGSTAPSSGGRMRGPQNAAVTLTEFGDYQCPSCGYYAPIVLEVMHRFPNQLKLEFHHYPLVGLHQWAMAAALAAEAAGDQGKFWEMHDLLYQNQDKWSKSVNAETDFVAYAGQLGLNVNQFMQSMHSPETQQRILQDVVRARDANLNETPTFFVNGQKLTSRPGTPDEFTKVIQEALPK
jgi:protein-disulfide isomerase